jgi:hypothetical protein
MWFLPFLGSGLIGKILSLGLNLVYELTLKLIGLIFYLASEYWGRWVLACLAAFIILCYARWHYIEEGRSREAAFRSLVVQAELEQRCEAKGGILREKPSNSWRLPEGWPQI